MRIGSIKVNNSLVLGPMAGVTDWAFRTICAQLGAGITVTEMVSSRALVYQDKKSAALLRKNEGSICGAQIFGNDPAIMAQAAQIALEISGCDFIDINMGCPMPKIANSGDGCGLMRTPELAGQILSAVVKAVNAPVTVKCRLGWDKGSINIYDFAKRMEDNGAAMLAVHGRTRSMLYTGSADWSAIAKVKRASGIPIIANGDIASAEAAIKCRNWTAADGYMVGRASLGDPWIFSEVKAALEGNEVPQRPALADRVGTALKQFELALEDKGEHIACLEARKHFAWYLRGVAHSNYYKEQISAIKTMEDIYRIAEGIRRDLK